MRYYLFEDSNGGTIVVLASSEYAARKAFGLSLVGYDFLHDFPVHELERFV